MIATGKRNKRISIYDVVYTNVNGERAPSLKLYKRAWANVRSAGGMEQEVGKSFVATVQHEFGVLFDVGIIPTQVIQWEGKTAHIKGAVDPDGLRREMKIWAIQTVNDQPPPGGA